MPTNVIMPQLGESVVEGTVSKWLKREGDRVEAFEPLLEISTDKVDSEIPAPADGVLLKIYIQEGETVEHGTVLAVIGQAGEQPEPIGTVRTAGSLGAAPLQTSAGHTNGKVEYIGHVTPVVARMAAEHHLDLAQISGTGREGRVTKKDVEAYLAQAKPLAPKEETPPWETPVEGDLFKPTVEYGAETESAMVRPTAAPILGSSD